MLSVRKIESFDAPQLQPYRTMRRQMEHRAQGIFVAEGEKVVRRLLESRFIVLSALMPEEWLAPLKPLLEARTETIEVFVAPKALLETLTGFSMYQGLLAAGKIPAPDALESLLQRTAGPRLLAAVDGLTNAENMGAIVRNCAAFGAQGLIVGETCSSPFLRRAVRSSMGTVFELPIIETAHLAATLQTLQTQGFHCVAAHPHADKLTPTQAPFAGDCCVVLGSEGYGISPEVLAACDKAAAIPMPPRIDSLNVAAAAAVFLYEACRQRGQM